MNPGKSNSPPDLNKKNWKTFLNQYGIYSDSLWLIDSRDKTGGHSTLNHGGFIPQVPRQAILRFTKPYDLVIDGFLGYGTSLIECKRWGRSGIGVEINNDIANIALDRLNQEPNPHEVSTRIIKGDSSTVNLNSITKELGVKHASLVILHPPYHNIIKYSDDPQNLCNANNLDSFIQSYISVVRNLTSLLDVGGYVELIIGDKYENGEWIPLGFLLMNATLEQGFKLKSVCVKNIEETIGKRNTINLWKYRTLMAGSHFFKHEYVFFLEKIK